MRVRIARWIPHATQTNRFLRWSRNAFLVAGALALGYSGNVLLDAKIFQAYQARQFQQQLSTVHLTMVNASSIGSPTVTTIPGGLWEESKSTESVLRR